VGVVQTFYALNPPSPHQNHLMQKLTFVADVPKATAEARESTMQTTHSDLFKAIEENNVTSLETAFSLLPPMVQKDLIDRMLFHACEKGQTEAVKCCLKLGACATHRDLVVGNTPWHVAAKVGMAGVIDMLTEHAKENRIDLPSILTSANVRGGP